MTLGELYDLLAQLKPVIGDEAEIKAGWTDGEEAISEWRAEPGKLVLL